MSYLSSWESILAPKVKKATVLSEKKEAYHALRKKKDSVRVSLYPCNLKGYASWRLVVFMGSTVRCIAKVDDYGYVNFYFDKKNLIILPAEIGYKVQDAGGDGRKRDARQVILVGKDVPEQLGLPPERINARSVNFSVIEEGGLVISLEELK